MKQLAQRGDGAAAIFPWTGSPPRLLFHGSMENSKQPPLYDFVIFFSEKEREKHAEINR
jgi:hypothetical protein